MSIKIIRPGLFTTIQDLGRYGYQKFGVIASGAMDTYSLRIANILVGNHEGEAAIEITLHGPKLLFEQDQLIAITGGDLTPTIDGKAVPLWRPVYVKKGSEVKFGAPKIGCRAYLAVAGGMAVEEVMKSKSTYTRAGIGGYEGRALQAGDVVATNPTSHHVRLFMNKLKNKQPSLPFQSTNWFVNWNEFLPLSRKNFIRTLPGAQFHQFTTQSKNKFFTEGFKVLPQSDRMGYKLSGPTLKLKEKVEMLSEAVVHGTIQIPPDGQPIILLVDRQTTGGYPKLAQIASIDLSLVAQMKPGERIQFTDITIEDAEHLYLEREERFKQLVGSIHYSLREQIL
ncbi:biotin-dependent carboxyltransferase family protein [Metabacillus sp. HB246100]